MTPKLDRQKLREACEKATWRIVQCEICQKQFDVPKWKISRGLGKTCSRSCNSTRTARILPRIPTETRFWAKVEKTKTCWIWTGYRLPLGQGQFYFAPGKTILAHRWSFISRYGEIPKDLHICHKCDNPSCVRPSHLFAGTRSDNMRDMVQKKRHWFLKESSRKRMLASAKHARESVPYEKNLKYLANGRAALARLRGGG